MLDPVPGARTNCLRIPVTLVTSASIAQKAVSGAIGRGIMTWRGIIARTEYVVADEEIMLVGVAATADRSAPDSALDQLNAEITAVVACQQHMVPDDRRCFAALTRNGKTFLVWHCDIVRTKLRISRHFFSRDTKYSRQSLVMPSAVVSFVIRQRECVKRIAETTR